MPHRGAEYRSGGKIHSKRSGKTKIKRALTKHPMVKRTAPQQEVAAATQRKKDNPHGRINLPGGRVGGGVLPGGIVGGGVNPTAPSAPTAPLGSLAPAPSVNPSPQMNVAVPQAQAISPSGLAGAVQGAQPRAVRARRGGTGHKGSSTR